MKTNPNDPAMEEEGDYMNDPEYIQGNLDAFECSKCFSLFGFDCICDQKSESMSSDEED